MQKTVLAAILVFFCCLALPASLVAQETEPDESGSTDSQLDFSFAPRFWGATVFTRYALLPPARSQVETSLIVGLSGAWETVGYYRSPDGSQFADGDFGFTADATSFNRTDLYWQLGVQQGIAPREDITDDLAVVFAFYRGRLDLPQRDDERLYFSSGLPEMDGGLIGSIHAGVAFSTIVDDPILATRSGILGEFVLQSGPSFLHNTVLGDADFTRMTLSTRAFYPIFAAEPRDGRNLLSSYVAAFGAVDWATGPVVPMAVRNSIGTRSERPGLGGSVRGFESRRFDATLKAVGNVEVRTNLRTLSPGWIIPDITPGIIIYTDIGYYNDLDLLSPVAGEESGFISASGAGVFFDVKNVFELIFYTNVLWEPTAVDGSVWMPFSLGFGFHF